MTPDQLAQEARRLLADDTFAEILTNIRMKALVALADVDPDNKTAILASQAMVRVTDEIRAELTAMILANGEQNGGFEPDKPTEQSTSA